jgi:hypothetical protein
MACRSASATSWASKTQVPARRPNLGVAAAELAFAAAMFVCGFAGAPLWVAGLVAAAMLVYWTWTRRVALNRLRGANWAIQAFAAVAVMIIVLAGAYWLGLALKGLFA